jgi:signal peptide peptidase SppA
MLNKQLLFSQINNELMMISPEFNHTSLVNELNRIEASEDKSFLYTPESMLAEGKAYRVREGGVAEIPIHGYLAHRDNGHIPNLYTGYDYITNLINAAVEDDSVQQIVLDVNSPGGMVNGAFEAADVIREARDKKPITAIVDSSAYSAAYLLSSAATEIFAPKAGGVGSIGVVTMHVDYSKALEDQGIKVTMLYAGKHKVDGNPYAELTAGAKSRIETRLNQSYMLFVNTVASNRGLDTDTVIATEAGVYQGNDAQRYGLIDAVKSPKSAFAVVAGKLDKLKGGIQMSVEQVEAANVEVAVTEQIESAKQEAVVNEQKRIQAILDCDEASGRTNLAKHLAFNSRMSVEEAKSLLAVSAKEATKTEAKSNLFEDAMNASENPNVGAGNEMASDEPVDVVASIVASWKKQTGRN